MKTISTILGFTLAGLFASSIAISSGPSTDSDLSSAIRSAANVNPATCFDDPSFARANFRFSGIETGAADLCDRTVQG